jgi:hypothetical protein
MECRFVAAAAAVHRLPLPDPADLKEECDLGPRRGPRSSWCADGLKVRFSNWLLTASMLYGMEQSSRIQFRRPRPFGGGGVRVR